MRYGFNLLLWTTHVTEEHFPILEKLKKTGYDGVEIPIFEGDEAHYQAIKKELDNQGLACTTVCLVTEAANPISPDAAVREAAVERLKWAPRTGRPRLVADLMAGPFHSPLAVFTGEGPTEDEKKRAADVLRQAAEYAEKEKVKLAIEYLNRFECYFLTTAADARALVKAVDHPYFRSMYDTFHANIEEKNLTQDDFPIFRQLHSRPHQRKRPRHSRHRPRALGRNLSSVARDQVRRLADYRSVRPGLAGPGCRHQGLARPVPQCRGSLHAGPALHEGEMGRGGEEEVTSRGIVKSGWKDDEPALRSGSAGRAGPTAPVGPALPAELHFQFFRTL